MYLRCDMGSSFMKSKLFPSPPSVPSVSRVSWVLLVLMRYTHIGLGTTWAGGMVVLDSLVFFMTLYKSSIVIPRPHGGNILDILLRDGEF